MGRRGETWSRAGALLAVVSTVAVLVGTAGTAHAVGRAATTPASGSDGSYPAAGLTQKLAAIDVNGGYVASGTGLRNRGYGSIHVAGVPTGSSVERAFLYWNVDAHTFTPRATFPTGRIDGTPIAGTLVGAWHGGTCTNGDHSYSYRADVTNLVRGNGDYRLSSFRS